MVLAVRTPHREPEGATENQRTLSSLDSIDVEWVAEHARQVGNVQAKTSAVVFTCVPKSSLEKDAISQYVLTYTIYYTCNVPKCLG